MASGTHESADVEAVVENAIEEAGTGVLTVTGAQALIYPEDVAPMKNPPAVSNWAPLKVAVPKVAVTGLALTVRVPPGAGVEHVGSVKAPRDIAGDSIENTFPQPSLAVAAGWDARREVATAVDEGAEVNSR